MQKKLVQWSFFIFLILIPFGTKKFLFDLRFPIANWYTNEYTSIFLYASDIALIIFVALTLIFFWESSATLIKKYWFVLVFLTIAFISLVFTSNILLSVYYLFRLLLVVLAAFCVGTVLRERIIKFDHVMWVIAGSAVFQSIVGMLQFIYARSAGVWFLGETPVTLFTKGIARVALEGGRFLRAYGTFPHANIYAGFLVVGLISFFYLWMRRDARTYKTVFAFLPSLGIGAGIFLTLLGLIVSFSRSGWITAIVGAALMIIYGLWNLHTRTRALTLSLILVTCFVIFINNFSWAIFPRTHLSLQEPSVNERVIYNKIGFEIVTQSSFGVGIGNELVYGVQNKLFQAHGLRGVQQFQPIHNLYLLIASEIGLLGLFALLVFISNLFKNMWRNIKDNNSLSLTTSYLFLISLLVFGLFDHFLWDLEAGRLMLWLVLGILIGVSSRSSTDRTPPSEGGDRGSIPLESTK